MKVAIARMPQAARVRMHHSQDAQAAIHLANDAAAHGLAVTVELDVSNPRIALRPGGQGGQDNRLCWFPQAEQYPTGFFLPPIAFAVLGAVFIIVLPQVLAIAKGWLPEGMAPGGLQAVVFGLILILFIIFKPLGLYGRWLKIRTYFDVFPFYRRGTFRRQRTYLRSERLR